MRRICYCAGPIAVLAIGLLLLHFAGRVAAQKPDPPLQSSPAGDASPADAPLSPEPPSPDVSAQTPAAPEPPIPFDENAGWMPLADALPSPVSAPEPCLNGPEAEEIMRIREKLQINPFEGTVIEQGLPEQILELSRGAPSLPATCPTGDDDFAAALRRITIAQAPSSEEPNLIAPEEEAWTTPTEEQPQASADIELAASLRAACRALESRANDHEDVGEYDRADDLRSLAEELRREGRRLDASGEIARRRSAVMH
jgi:hypothetical protein